MNFKLIILFLLFPFILIAQESQDSIQSPVEVLHMDKGVTERVGDETINYLFGNVQFKQDSVYMYCDTAILKDKMIEAKGRVVIIQEDSVKVFSDYLHYNGYIGKARLLSNVVLASGEQRLFTDTLDYDTHTKIGTYTGSAILTNASTKLISLRGNYNAETKHAFFKDSVFVIDSLFSLQTDSMGYDAGSEKAIFLGPTLVQRDSSEMYCEAGYYMIGEEFANFKQNAQYRKGNILAQADSILYRGKKKEISLLGNSKYREGNTYAEADSILYYELTENAELRGNAYYSGDDRKARGPLIQYNGKTGSISTKGKTTISEEGREIHAEELKYDGETDVGFAKGNVVWRDTSAKTTLFSEEVNYKKETEFVKAFGKRPILLIEIDGDSLFIVADTLLSESLLLASNPPETVMNKSVIDTSASQKIIDSLNQQKDSLFIIPDTLSGRVDSLPIVPDTLMRDSLALSSMNVEQDSITILVGHPDVRIFKSDFQAICDSLYFNDRDSVFHLIGRPIMWSENSQFTGDTIFVFLKNGKIDKVNIVNNGFILSTEESIFFNQIKGKLITAYFKEGEITKMHVKGNAETIYYILDDSTAYIGVNQLICSEIWVYFNDGQVSRIKNMDKPDGHSYPMRGTNHDALKLKGFRWLDEMRPKHYDEFFAQVEVTNTE